MFRFGYMENPLLLVYVHWIGPSDVVASLCPFSQVASLAKTHKGTLWPC